MTQNGFMFPPRLLSVDFSQVLLILNKTIKTSSYRNVIRRNINPLNDIGIKVMVGKTYISHIINKKSHNYDGYKLR